MSLICILIFEETEDIQESEVRQHTSSIPVEHGELKLLVNTILKTI